jgi:hypothetical protein
MRSSHSSAPACWASLAAGLPPGIYPYLGGSVSPGQLRAASAAYGGAVVPGKAGVRLAAQAPGVLVDPARYGRQPREAPDHLFGYDEWLERQRMAGVPVILTDTPRVRNEDRPALHLALARWELIDEPTMVVLPLEPWWFRDGLQCLTEEVAAAGRPVAVVLLHHFNGLDAAGAVEGLLTFISAVGDLPVVLLRCDVSAVGAVAHGAFAGFVGWSALTRHGPLPMRRPRRGVDDGERDESPAVFVPALHGYSKASRLPAFARGGRPDILDCGGPACAAAGGTSGADSLLRIARLSEVDLPTARSAAYHHNAASAERVAQRVLASASPAAAWWEACNAGADITASLIECGVGLPVPRWLRQWLAVGSPAREPVFAG